jgi:hypothetical protein
MGMGTAAKRQDGSQMRALAVRTKNGKHRKVHRFILSAPLLKVLYQEELEQGESQERRGVLNRRAPQKSSRIEIQTPSMRGGFSGGA